MPRLLRAGRTQKTGGAQNLSGKQRPIRGGNTTDQQKCASAPHFRPKDFSLPAYVRANFAERNEIHRAEKARKDAAKIG